MLTVFLPASRNQLTTFIKRSLHGMAATASPDGSSKASSSNKRLSIERIYQKKTQLEHILLRPDTYIGSTENYKTNMWVYDEGIGFNYREISYVPGLYKIFDEILVNAADNKQRDPNMKRIKIEINPEDNKIMIMNDGKGIPVAMHKEHDMYVPTLIFGHLLTSSNYDDSQKKVTGGRNGFGAKLCNVFSKKFIVETSCKSSGKYFKQEWQDNMSKAGKVSTSGNKSSDFTRVTFYPDLSKFNMDVLDKDTVALMKRRAYDVAATSSGVSVELNGEKLPVKNFKEYCSLYINACRKDELDEEKKAVDMVYEKVNNRWEIAVGTSQKGFQQVSFVNSIATTKGGTHVDYISSQVVSKIQATCQKKVAKGGVEIKPAQVKQHLFLFVNSLIENPAFDSQTKENMTLKKQKFGSTCEPSEKFLKDILKTGIVDFVMDWATTKSQRQLAAKSAGKKSSRIQGVPKLSDANDAGTARSKDCTLILTEGDSAKSLALAGVGVIGRDKFGVFPLRGKLLNVREATHKQILENAELSSIIKIVGLKYGKKYETDSDMATLRYGKIMIMADQDVDGSHIKGLVINFIHHNWPTLLKMNFLCQFITPIIRASSKGKQTVSFYSVPEFKEWKDQQQNIKQWNLKYYKGLGTSTNNEAKEYFADIGRHRIRFRYLGVEDDNKINMAFSRKEIDSRKEWLINGMQIRRERREQGLSELYLYGKSQTSVTFQQFIDDELMLFSNYDNERSIPSLVDGLKPGQRKVLFTCFKRNLKKEIKVAQLVGSVSEMSAYHHGEASLAGTVINLAQDFVGSNNLNLLEPNGQFGTRIYGGSDSAASRYIFTKLSPLARLVFPLVDDNVLISNWDDNKKVEPLWYAPIIPMVLINGAQGIGTGFSTCIPNFSVKEVIANLKRIIRNEEFKEMHPSYRNFKGDIVKLEEQKYISVGRIIRTNDNVFQITELPIGTWTQNYLDKVMIPAAEGTGTGKPIFTDFKDYHTDQDVKFIIHAPKTSIDTWEFDGIHAKFKLTSHVNTSCMVLHDGHGVLKKYETPKEIMEDFYTVRLDIYKKRKEYLVGKLDAEAQQLLNKARFINEKIEGKIKVENVKHRNLITTLQTRGYDSDPVKVWQENYNKLMNTNPEDVDVEEEDNNTNSDDDTLDAEAAKPGDPCYNYLIDMAIRTLTMERKLALEKKRDEKLAELDVVKNTSLSDMWLADLKELELGITKYEAEKAKKAAEINKCVKNAKSKKRYSSAHLDDIGEVVPFKKVEAKAKVKREPKEPKAPKEKKPPKPKAEPKAKNGTDESKPKKKNTKSPKKRKGKQEWETDSEDEESLSDFDITSEEDFNSESDDASPPSAKKTNGEPPAPAAPPAKKRVKKLGPSTIKQTTLDGFTKPKTEQDSEVENKKKNKVSPKKRLPVFDSSEDEKPTKKEKNKKKKVVLSGSDSDFSLDDMPPLSKRVAAGTGRARKAVAYNFGDDSESD